MHLFLLNCSFVVHSMRHQRSVSTGGTGSWAEKDGDVRVVGITVQAWGKMKKDSALFGGFATCNLR